MWSVWSDMFPARVCIHVGSGYAMLCNGRHASEVFEFPQDLPLDRVLSRLDKRLPAVTKKYWQRKPALQVTLGATRCRALSLSVPAALRSWQELQTVATAQAAQALGRQAEHIQCALNPRDHGTMGVMDSDALVQLHDWATRRQFHLVSVAPLWAIASACKAVQMDKCYAIAVQEPDAITLLVNAQGTPQQAATIPTLADKNSAEILMRRHLVSMNVPESDVLRINFATQVQTRATTLPALWSGHWSAP